MGFDSEAVDKMSLWKFLAAQGGYAAAHGGPTDVGLSEDEFQELAKIV